MDLLFKRSQTKGATGRVFFRLWSKALFNEEERALTKRYHLDEAVLIFADQPKLLRNTILWSFVCWWLSSGFFMAISKSVPFATIASTLATIGFGFWYYHQMRETIYVRDLIYGRYFKCNSVVELARKEAWLETVCAFLRQVMESAKHWDGQTRFPIEALPKDEARQVIIKGL